MMLFSSQLSFADKIDSLGRHRCPTDVVDREMAVGQDLDLERFETSLRFFEIVLGIDKGGAVGVSMDRIFLRSIALVDNSFRPDDLGKKLPFVLNPVLLVCCVNLGFQMVDLGVFIMIPENRCRRVCKDGCHGGVVVDALNSRRGTLLMDGNGKLFRQALCGLVRIEFPSDRQDKTGRNFVEQASICLEDREVRLDCRDGRFGGITDAEICFGSRGRCRSGKKYGCEGTKGVGVSHIAISSSAAVAVKDLTLQREVEVRAVPVVSRHFRA